MRLQGSSKTKIHDFWALLRIIATSRYENGRRVDLLSHYWHSVVGDRMPVGGQEIRIHRTIGIPMETDARDFDIGLI